MSYAAAPATGLDRDYQLVANEYSQIESLADIWSIVARQHGQVTALSAPHEQPAVSISYSQLFEQMQRFAAGLQGLGVATGDRIALFADNSPRWLIADQASLMAGAVNVVRSAQADAAELLYILQDSGSTSLIVEDQATLKKIASALEPLPIRVIILLSQEEPTSPLPIKILNFAQVLEAGATGDVRAVPVKKQDLATLIYTSGTTGQPKGVMLSHANLLHQVNTFKSVIQPQAGDRILSILPTWHSYERACEYFLLSCGCTQVYTNLRHIKQDLKRVKPNYMVAVPRLWESVYEGVQRQFREQPASKQRLINFFLDISQRYITAKRLVTGLSLTNLHPSGWQKLLGSLQVLLLKPLHGLGEKIVYQKIREAATGGELRYVISGGGSLAQHLDLFFEIIGVEILVGYGLTETSPVLSVRRPWANLRGSAGKPIPLTEIKIVDPESRQVLPLGQKGVVVVHGPQVMQGYYNKPEATAKVLDSEDWFDTGDIGWLTKQQDLVLTGRLKDTIVLTNGENIEPQPIEDACLRSPYIDQIMLVGQDQKVLGALIVPNWEALKTWAIAQNYSLQLPSEPPTNGEAISLTSKPIQDLYRQELVREVKNRPSYRADDRIGSFSFIAEPFSQENGMMTQTLKIRRNVVMDRYHDMINGMFDGQ
jgi:long-chain acyl-CoA synthetase